MPGSIYHPSPSKTLRIAVLTSSMYCKYKRGLDFLSKGSNNISPWLRYGQTTYPSLREMDLENGSFIDIDESGKLKQIDTEMYSKPEGPALLP